MDEKEVNFSLSYEQLTRIAEERIRECELDNQGAKYISESSKASALLGVRLENGKYPTIRASPNSQRRFLISVCSSMKGKG